MKNNHVNNNTSLRDLVSMLGGKVTGVLSDLSTLPEKVEAPILHQPLNQRFKIQFN